MTDDDDRDPGPSRQERFDWSVASALGRIELAIARLDRETSRREAADAALASIAATLNRLERSMAIVDASLARMSAAIDKLQVDRVEEHGDDCNCERCR